MDKTKIIECLLQVLENKINVDEITQTTLLKDIGINSISFIRFIVAIEDTFDITVNDSDLLFTNFDTLQKVYETLAKYFKNEQIPLKKCLVLDCDNVLWQGISSEGEITPNINFQAQVVELYKRGILICICSKNDEDAINSVFELHSGMPLKKDYIVLSKVNWSDKVINIKEIAFELDIGLDSIVFIDDSKYEIGAVNGLLPDVTSIKFDENIDLQDLFDINELTSESTNRTQLYKEQKSREKAKSSFETIEEYNNSLQTKIEIKPVLIIDIPRVIELSNRTTQFNLSIKKYDDKKLDTMLNSDKYTFLTMCARDIYGDMGVVGVAVIHYENDTAIIEAFMLSCRVLGRGFESIMLSEIKSIAKKKDYINIKGTYVKTDRNSRFASFYQDNGVDI